MKQKTTLEIERMEVNYTNEVSFELKQALK